MSLVGNDDMRKMSSTKASPHLKEKNVEIWRGQESRQEDVPGCPTISRETLTYAVNVAQYTDGDRVSLLL